MKKSKQICLFMFFVFSSFLVKANDPPKESAGDLLILGQAFINLSLTDKYFDTLKITRIVKILRYEEQELASIKDTGFIKANLSLYNITYSLLYLGKAKLLFSNKKDHSRKMLLKWKSTLDSAIHYFNYSGMEYGRYYISGKPDYEFIGFTFELCDQLEIDINTLKDQFNPYFNRDIYPDFKRIFFQERNTTQFSFDSLLRYTALYNLPIRSHILNLLEDSSRDSYIETYEDVKINGNYDLDPALDLISRYLQLNYVAQNFDSLCTVEEILYEYKSFEEKLNPQNADSFNTSSYNYLKSQLPKDEFFRNNLDTTACNRLLNKLKSIIKPGDCPAEIDKAHNVGSGHDDFPKRKYYFPVPAPFPSAYRYIYNYKPGLKKMKAVDDYLKVIFNNAGYKNRMQYYYVQSGYAMTTSLEAIDKAGAPLKVDKRWNVTVAGNGKFSMYNVFKSIFFDTESNFRIFALVISPSVIDIQSSATSIGAMQDLLVNSYPKLPKDLENLVLPEKELTILVYNFHQNDIGEVPMLDVSNKLSVEDHLKKSGLSGILKNP